MAHLGMLGKIFDNEKDSGEIIFLPMDVLNGKNVYRSIREIVVSGGTIRFWLHYIRGVCDDDQIEAIEIHGSREKASRPLGKRVSSTVFDSIWYEAGNSYYNCPAYFKSHNSNPTESGDEESWARTTSLLLLGEIIMKVGFAIEDEK